MARASGRAIDGALTGALDHRPSGVHYSVYQEDGRLWMSFERTSEPKISGKRELLYYIGSNRKGRTYVFSTDGFLFETPINWYSQEQRWNMAPGYTEDRTIPMTLPLVIDCLNCHASGVRMPVPGTRNKYTSVPFVHGGIGCERCHGVGAGHAGGSGPIVNPAKLAPERRDAICMECHLEGSVAIERRGHHVSEFRPGDNLFDYIQYFVLKGPLPQSPRALSQVEALAMSVCKQKSGDRMWCGSCHDPHFEPAPAEKAAYYREKCVACHTEPFAAKHHPEKPDCVSCHMPPLPSSAVAHTQATDHRILRRPFASIDTVAANRAPEQLLPYPPGKTAELRELALAWESLAEHGHQGAAEESDRLLTQAVSKEPDDPALLTGLAYIEQQKGHADQARSLYQRALKLDPLATDAATNLGVLDAKQGDIKSAVELWEPAFSRAPYQSAVGTNLAIVFCSAGDVAQAQSIVERVLQFNPDFAPAAHLREHMQEHSPVCKP